MNWLIYVCGGYLWVSLWDRLVADKDWAFSWQVTLICSLCSWFWICWKFFSEVGKGWTLQ